MKLYIQKRVLDCVYKVLGSISVNAVKIQLYIEVIIPCVSGGKALETLQRLRKACWTYIQR